MNPKTEAVTPKEKAVEIAWHKFTAEPWGEGNVIKRLFGEMWDTACSHQRGVDAGIVTGWHIKKGGYTELAHVILKGEE